MGYKITDKRSLDQSDLKDLVFLGIQGMIDPPREEAIEGVRKCRSAGIRVVMMTGDYAITAKAISCKLGINADRVITGDDLSKMSDDELYDIVEDVLVYARVAPEHKFRVTKALQKT